MTTFDVISLLPPGFLADALRSDASAGLTRSPKRLPPKWFYDDRGSELFELITRLPEYYPTRAETAILRARAGEIASASRAHTLVELGSGSAEKTVPLLDALRDCGSLRRYVPVDVSEAALLVAGRRVRAAHPGLSVLAITSNCTARSVHLEALARARAVHVPRRAPLRGAGQHVPAAPSLDLLVVWTVR